MYYEQFQADQTTVTASRLIETERVEAFLELSGLVNPIFMDDAAARAAGHPGRLVPGPLILALAMGLIQETGLFDHVAAVLEFDKLKFLQTVYPGDAVRVHCRVRDKRPTRNPARGLVNLSYRVENQHGRAVLSTEAAYLMRTRSGA